MMFLFYCAECQVMGCKTGKLDKLPASCPMNLTDLKKEILAEYKEDILSFAKQSALTESAGYCQWTRVQEIIHFSKQMKYKKLGIAFCTGLKKEAAILSRILRAHGFEVCSIICKNCAASKEDVLGIKDEEKVRPGQLENMCNPIGQAKYLNYAQTDFNIAVGLCVGHDSLFFKYANSPTTVLIAKDRALAHNPAGALYCAEGYFNKKVFPQE